ncbi:tRNA (guanine-N7)-methyltransferase, partial [Streptococcus pneumoniae]|nr:tRNA (guanine-N7)-methyltransferase [Streptococcus pneumoniae]
ILAEHDSCIKNDEAVRNFVTSVLLSAFVSALVSAMISLEIQTYKFVIPFIIGMIWTVVVFLMINWNYIANTKKRQKYI